MGIMSGVESAIRPYTAIIIDEDTWIYHIVYMESKVYIPIKLVIIGRPNRQIKILRFDYILTNKPQLASPCPCINL